MSQKLDISLNYLRALPDHLSSLKALGTFIVDYNRLSVVPFSIVQALTALTTIKIRHQARRGDAPPFRVPSSVSPILHPLLMELALEQEFDHPDGWEWDPTSLFHLGYALADVADRNPVPKLSF